MKGIKKMKTKTFLSVAFLLALVVILAIGAFAAENFDDHAKTNVKGLSIAGYQVRTIGYNGHRTTFNFNSNAFADYELVEAGSIVATAANFAKYEQSFDESNSIIKYVIIVIIAIYFKSFFCLSDNICFFIFTPFL